MNICHICSNFDGFFDHFMESQRKNNLDLRVFYFRAKERGLPESKRDYVDVRLNYNNFQRPFFLWKENSVYNDFVKLYHNQDFDLNHAHTLFSNGYIALKKKMSDGTPYVVAVRDMDLNVFLKYRIHLRPLAQKILMEAEKVVFLSESYRDELIKSYTPKNNRETILKKSIIIPNGVDDFFLKNYKDQKKTIEEGKIKVLTVGYICKRKNQLNVCKAIKNMVEKGYDVEYLIIGKVLDEKIFNEIMDYNFVKHYPFMSKENLIEEYRNAHIFAMPSYTETFGLTYLEALSQGIPVIYSKNQGFDGQFKEGTVGYNVNPADVLSIEKSLIKIINKYSEFYWNEEILNSKYGWDSISKKYIEIYKEILLNRKRKLLT